MTLDTRIYIEGKIDYREVFVKCDQLIGAHEGIRFTDEPVPLWEDGERKRGPEDGMWFIWNEMGQGLCALLDIEPNDLEKKSQRARVLCAQPEPIGIDGRRNCIGICC